MSDADAEVVPSCFCADLVLCRSCNRPVAHRELPIRAGLNRAAYETGPGKIGNNG